MAEQMPLSPGPELWQNWRAHADGQAYEGGFESALYTDAHIVGDLDDALGPYRLFNALGRNPFAAAGELGVGVVARVAWHIPIQHAVDPNGPDRPTKSRTDHWVAIPLADQLACLLSLLLAARIRSGGGIRDFDAGPDADPAGRPAFYQHQPPTLTRPLRDCVIPDIAGAQVELGSASPLLSKFGQLDATTATVLLRAARLYRQSLWVADDDCELAWLLMVSSIETVAAHWHVADRSPAETLQDDNPALAELLVSHGGQHLLEQATALMVLNRPTAATREFLLKFATPPPEDERPQEWARFNFEELKKAVGTIYSCRSNTLHGGLPFPAPLLQPPWRGDMSAYAEIPMGLWTQYGSETTWMAKDTPMLFHTFAGLTRRALLAWWQQLDERRDQAATETS